MKTLPCSIIWLIISAQIVTSVTWYLSNEGACLLLVMILICHISQIVCLQCHSLQNVCEQCFAILFGRSSLCWTWHIRVIIRCTYSTLTHLLYHLTFAYLANVGIILLIRVFLFSSPLSVNIMFLWWNLADLQSLYRRKLWSIKFWWPSGVISFWWQPCSPSSTDQDFLWKCTFMVIKWSKKYCGCTLHGNSCKLAISIWKRVRLFVIFSISCSFHFPYIRFW